MRSFTEISFSSSTSNKQSGRKGPQQKLIQTAWKASGKVRDRAIPKADSMRLWLKSSCAKSSLVVAISTVPGTYLYPFYNHFQQQVTPSPAASLQLHCTPSGAPLGSEASVGAVQSPPRNKIATIKIELWLLWKLFITWYVKIIENWFGKMVLPKTSFRVSGYIKPVWSKQTGGHLFSSNGMTR